MRAEPGRNPAGGGDRPERRELGLAIEPVARLALEGRRAGAQHPVAMARDGASQTLCSGRSRRRDGREDPAAGGVQLLVARAGRAERELVHPISAERRMGVAVDEPRDRAQAAGVDLLDLALEGAERAHPSDRLDLGAAAEDVGVVDPVEIARARCRAAARRGRPGSRPGRDRGSGAGSRGRAYFSGSCPQFIRE